MHITEFKVNTEQKVGEHHKLYCTDKSYYTVLQPNIRMPIIEYNASYVSKYYIWSTEGSFFFMHILTESKGILPFC